MALSNAFVFRQVVFQHYRSLWASHADFANGCLYFRFEVDHEIQAGFSIADEKSAETYRSDRPTADSHSIVLHVATSVLGQTPKCRRSSQEINPNPNGSNKDSRQSCPDSNHTKR